MNLCCVCDKTFHFDFLLFSRLQSVYHQSYQTHQISSDTVDSFWSPARQPEGILLLVLLPRKYRIMLPKDGVGAVFITKIHKRDYSAWNHNCIK